MRTLYIVLSLVAASAFGQGMEVLPFGQYSLQVSRNGHLHAINKGVSFGSEDIVYRYNETTKLWLEVARLDWYFRLGVIYDDLILNSRSDGTQTNIQIVYGTSFDSLKGTYLFESSKCHDFGYDSTVYIGTDYYGIYSSKDLKQWDTLRSTTVTWEAIRALFATPDKLFACTNNSVVSTGNNGITWNKLYLGQPIEKLAVYKDTIYAITFKGEFLSGVDTLFAKGIQLNAPEPEYILCVDKQGVVYYLCQVGNSRRIIRSRSGGANWDSLAFSNVMSIACDSSGRIYLATNNRVHSSSDHGTTWDELNVETSLEAPNHFSLYPNPIDNRFYIHSSSEFYGATVELYNTLGRRVLMEKYINAFDVSNLPSGIYHVIIRMGDEIFISKVVKQRL